MSPEFIAAFEEITLDLESELNARYLMTGQACHPALRRQYERDMAPVVKAKELLARLRSETI